MEHKYENNIKCPYCNWEDQDSWEFQDDEGIQICGNCEEEFNVERNVEVTYSTSRIDCEEKKEEHDYKTDSYFKKTREFSNGKWKDIPDDKHTFHRIDMCVKCGDKNCTNVSVDEYELGKGY